MQKLNKCVKTGRPSGRSIRHSGRKKAGFEGSSGTMAGATDY